MDDTGEDEDGALQSIDSQLPIPVAQQPPNGNPSKIRTKLPGGRERSIVEGAPREVDKVSENISPRKSVEVEPKLIPNPLKPSSGLKYIPFENLNPFGRSGESKAFSMQLELEEETDEEQEQLCIDPRLTLIEPDLLEEEEKSFDLFGLVDMGSDRQVGDIKRRAKSGQRKGSMMERRNVHPSMHEGPQLDYGLDGDSLHDSNSKFSDIFRQAMEDPFLSSKAQGNPWGIDPVSPPGFLEANLNPQPELDSVPFDDGLPPAQRLVFQRRLFRARAKLREAVEWKKHLKDQVHEAKLTTEDAAAKIMLDNKYLQFMAKMGSPDVQTLAGKISRLPTEAQLTKHPISLWPDAIYYERIVIRAQRENDDEARQEYLEKRVRVEEMRPVGKEIEKNT